MTGKSRRGFASMDPSRQREIASKGGRAAHAKGTAHEWSSDEARTAGRKGGEVVSRDRAHMAAIGREGGEARGRKNAALRQQRQQQQPSGDQFSDRESPVMVSREGVNRGADRHQSGESSRESSRGRVGTNDQNADRGDDANDQG
jgi:general stress protein YciG